jgi:branched-chain amino acid transport system ATP-binding protein
MSEPILVLENVFTDIGQYHILTGVDLVAGRGEVTMLLGRNGVGKTTTLRTIMGMLKARSGRILFEGEDIAGLSSNAIARRGIAIVPEDMGIFSDLTVEENLVLAAIGGPIDPARLDWITTAFPPLRTFWKMQAGNLSGGQKQMLSIARAVIEERRLYLIDEPSKGLAPAIVGTLSRALQDLKGGGASILMVEQNFSMARRLGDGAAVMDDGRTVWSGRMEQLARDAGLQQELMGLSMGEH